MLERLSPLLRFPLESSADFASHTWQSLAKNSPVAADHGFEQQGHLGGRFAVERVCSVMVFQQNR